MKKNQFLSILFCGLFLASFVYADQLQTKLDAPFHSLSISEEWEPFNIEDYNFNFELKDFENVDLDISVGTVKLDPNFTLIDLEQELVNGLAKAETPSFLKISFSDLEEDDEFPKVYDLAIDKVMINGIEWVKVRTAYDSQIITESYSGNILLSKTVELLPAMSVDYFTIINRTVYMISFMAPARSYDSVSPIFEETLMGLYQNVTE